MKVANLINLFFFDKGILINFAIEKSKFQKIVVLFFCWNSVY